MCESICHFAGPVSADGLAVRRETDKRHYFTAPVSADGLAVRLETDNRQDFPAPLPKEDRVERTIIV